MAAVMNVKRMAGRFLAIYGWQPLGVLCVVLLLFVLAADYFYTEYENVSENIAALEKKSREMKRKTGQQKQLEATLKEKQEQLAQQRGKGFSATTPELAGALLLAEIQNLAAAPQITLEAGNALPPRLEEEFALLQAEGGFSARTRQLVALLEGMAHSPKILRVDTLKVVVQDPEQPNMLSVKLAVRGFYATPQKSSR